MSLRAGQKIDTHMRWFDPLALLLLLAALSVAASQLIATDWVDELYITWAVVFLGAILGFALGYSRFSGKVSVILALLYGVILIPWFLGLIYGNELPWLVRLSGMLEDLNVTYQQLSEANRVTSPLLFLILTSSFTWILSINAAYVLVRYGRPWKATIPVGLATLIIATLAVREAMHTGLLMAYIFLALLLVARINFLKNHGYQRGETLNLPGEVGYNLAVATVLASVFLFVFVWFSPALGATLPSFKEPWDRFAEPFDSIRDGAEKAFAPLNSSIGMVREDVVHDYYGDSLTLGRGNLLSDSTILVIEAPELPSGVPRYYWRARHFDFYENGTWENTQDGKRPLTPDQFNLDIQEYDKRWETTVRVTPDRRLATLFTPLEPQWISRPVEAQLAINPDGTADVVAMQATPYLTIGDVYTVRGSVSSATYADLRAAGTDYPEWIMERYLQVPDSVTDRTLELAKQIAGGYDNAYDAAAAITNYLRRNIQYQEFLPQRPPKDQDPVDWMLFDFRQGFCNYYASAEVILLRSLGIPARITVGYAQGDIIPISSLQAESNEFFPGQESGEVGLGGSVTYNVRQRDAHAWPEVFYPDIGWVEFEPTANQVPLLRPSGVEPVDAAGTEIEPESGVISDERPLMDDEVDLFQEPPQIASDPVPTPFPWKIVLPSLLVLLGMILWSVIPWRDLPALPVLLMNGFRRLGFKPPDFLRRWERLATLPPVARAYHELNRALVVIKARPKAYATPAERVSILVSHLPEAQDPAEVVVAEYHAITYSQMPGNQKNAIRGGRIIRKLSTKEWMRRYFPRFFSRKAPP